MPNYRRPSLPGATVFFTVGLADRGASTLVDQVDHLRSAVSETRVERPFEIVSWVVLPDHMHCIWTLPPGDADFSTRWGAIKSRFAVSMRRAGFTPPPPTGRRNGGVNPALRRKGEVGLWQPRFWDHHIRDGRDLDMHIRYCWTNPVKHGLVERPTDWLFSSIHRDIRMGRCDPDYAGEFKDGDFGEP